VAGEDGDGEQADPHGRQRAHRGLEHLRAAQRVHGHQRHAELGGAAHRARHRIRDVVVLQVEEDLLPARDDLAHEVGSGGGEELVADLEHADLARQAVDHGPGAPGVGKVQRDDQAILGRHPPSSSAAGRPG
jgi:hypothetical protein